MSRSNQPFRPVPAVNLLGIIGFVYSPNKDYASASLFQEQIS